MLCVTIRDNRPGSTMTRTYSELSQLETFEERFRYLALSGAVGEMTFGHDRWMNQQFYKSQEWHNVRSYVIARDNGFDLGSKERPISGRIMIHHIVPLSPDSLTDSDQTVLDPNYLISCSLATHNAIHFGDESLVSLPVERIPGDTLPWRD